MKNFIFVLLAITGITVAEQTIWNSSGSTSFKTDGNWTNGSPSTEDTAIFNGTSVINCTVDTAFKIGGILMDSSTYSGNFSDGGYRCTTTAYIAQIKTQGTLTLSGKLIQQADANVSISSGGTLTATSWDLYHIGTGTFQIKTSTVFDTLSCAYSGKTFTSSSSYSIKYPIFNGGAISNGSSITINFSENQTFDQNGTSLLGGGNYTFAAAVTGKKITFNKIVHGGTGALTFECKAASGVDTLYFTDTLKSVTASTAAHRIYKSNAQKAFFIFNNIYINFLKNSTTGFRIGNSNATDTAFFNFGRSNLYVGTKFDDSTYNNGQSVINFTGSPTFTSHGSFILGSNSNWNVDSLNLIIDTSAIISTLGKTLWDITINGGAGKIDTLRDSTVWHRFKHQSGKLKGLSNGGTVYGDSFSIAGSDTVFGRMSSAKWWTFANPLTWVQTSTGVRLLDSTKWDFISGGNFLNDSNLTVNRIRLSPSAGGKKLMFKGGNKVTINNGVVGDFSGLIGNLDSVLTSSSGIKETLSVAVRPVESYLYIKDIVMTGDSMICTTGCVNGGGNSGIKFGGGCIAPVIVRDSIIGKVATAYIDTVKLSAGTADSITVLSGTLPSGLVLTKSSGKITGTVNAIYARDSVRFKAWGCSNDSAYWIFSFSWDSLSATSIVSTRTDNDTGYHLDTMEVRGDFPVARIDSTMDSAQLGTVAVNIFYVSDSLLKFILPESTTVGSCTLLIADSISADTVYFYCAGTYAPDSFAISLSEVGSGTGTTTKYPDLAKYQSGDSVTIAAIPGAHASFNGWSGDTSTAADTLRFDVTKNWTLVAEFWADTFYVSHAGSGADSITYADDSIGPYGDSIKMYFHVPVDSIGQWFGRNALPGLDSQTVYLTKDTTVTASLREWINYSIDTSGGWGNALTSWTITGGLTHDSGTTVTMTATCSACSSFSGYSGGVTSPLKAYSFTITGDVSIAAGCEWGGTCGSATRNRWNPFRFGLRVGRGGFR